MDGLIRREMAMPAWLAGITSAILPLLEVVAIVAVLFLSSRIRFYLPFTPVPVTLQTLVVFILPFWCRFWRATIGLAAFALLGGVAAGMGVEFFASITGSTWGYVLGFLVAPAVAWSMPKRSGLWVPVVMGCMLAVIYMFGATWLAWWLDYPLYAALLLGVVPFLPGDLLKLAVAAGLVIWRDARRPRPEVTVQ